jgi:hypothetical protein
MIGASKTGTTTLIDYFLALPNTVSLVSRKLSQPDKHHEIHRFDRSNYHRAWKYIELLHEWTVAPILPKAQVSNTLRVHYTPHYLFDPYVADRIASFHSEEVQEAIDHRINSFEQLSAVSAEVDLAGPENLFKATNGYVGSSQFLILLRDPVDRLVSSYWFKQSHLFHGEDQGSKAQLMDFIEIEKEQR